jgi:hypothetical protein
MGEDDRATGAGGQKRPRGIYLPGAAENALTQVSLRDQEFLEPWLGGLLFVAYGLAFAVAGTYLAIRRDVT